MTATLTAEATKGAAARRGPRRGQSRNPREWWAQEDLRAPTTTGPGIDAATASLFKVAMQMHRRSMRPPTMSVQQIARPLWLAYFLGTAVVLSFSDDRRPDLYAMLAQDRLDL